MIGPFHDILKQVEDFRDHQDDFVTDIVRENEHEFIRLNTDEQLLEKGIDRTGLMIEPGYTPFTVRLKQAKGQITTHVTLRDTGDYHKSKQLVITGNSIEMIATDEKAGDLRRKYGDEIEGLTDENMQYMIDEFVGPGMQDRFRKAIQN